MYQPDCNQASMSAGSLIHPLSLRGARAVQRGQTSDVPPVNS